MKNNRMFQKTKIKSKLLILVPILFFLSCGGGGGSSSENNSDNNTPTDNQNTTLTTKVGVDLIVFENEGVTLNAIVSYDDTNTLTYKWTQIDGETISLANDSLKKLAFIAPNVDSNSSLTFKFEVSDNTGRSSSDEIVINVINLEKEASYQEVLSLTNPVKVTKSTIDIPFSYNIYPSTLITTGLSLRIYWDNTKLELTDIKEAFSTDYVEYSATQVDVLNTDNDSTTNSYTTVSWVNIKEGKWKTPNLPLNLMVPVFKVVDTNNGSTYINIRCAFESPKVGFYSKSVLIEF